MKVGIFLICLGGFLTIRVPLALINALHSFEQSQGIPWNALSGTDWLLMIAIGLVVGIIPILWGIHRILCHREQIKDQQEQKEQFSKRRKEPL
jgi:cadmium resistance protein CadD (predicted permease)